MKRKVRWRPLKIIRENLVASLIVGLSALFVGALSKYYLFSLLFALCVIIIILTWSVLEDYFGRLRHYAIIESKGFTELRSQGFRVDTHNDYEGLTGEYKGYIFDIYYNWIVFIHDKAVTFNVYFDPPKTEDGSIDHERLSTMYEKHKVSRWSFKRYGYWWREGALIMNNGVGFFNPSPKRMNKSMDLVVEILKSEGFEPMDRATLNQSRIENPWELIPEIELYFEDLDSE